MYTLNPTTTQDSITEHIKSLYPHLSVIEDGLLDDDDEAIQYNNDGTVKTFIVLWYSDVKRSARGRSFCDYKLDSHFATVDVVVVASSGAKCRTLLNDLTDKLIGFQTDEGGRMHKSNSLWGDSRNVIDDSNRPSRWARTSRFEFGISSKKVTP